MQHFPKAIVSIYEGDRIYYYLTYLAMKKYLFLSRKFVIISLMFGTGLFAAVTLLSWKGAPGSDYHRGEYVYDTIPQKNRGPVKDLDKELQQLEDASRQLENLKAKDWEKIQSDLDAALKNIDFDKISLQVKEAVDKIDFDKIGSEVEKSDSKN